MAKTRGTSIDVIWSKENLSQLADFSRTTSRVVGPGAMKAGLVIIAKKARANAPGEHKHRIRKLIKIRAKWHPRSKKVVGRVYVAFPKDKGGNFAEDAVIDGRPVTMAAIARVLEFGTPQLRPRKFMRNARETERGKAISAARSRWDVLIEKEWAKKGPKMWK